MIILRIRIACWVSKATNTLRLCNVSCFTLQQWLHERASMSRHMYVACLLKKWILIEIRPEV